MIVMFVIPNLSENKQTKKPFLYVISISNRKKITVAIKTTKYHNRYNHKKIDIVLRDMDPWG